MIDLDNKIGLKILKISLLVLGNIVLLLLIFLIFDFLIFFAEDSKYDKRTFGGYISAYKKNCFHSHFTLKNFDSWIIYKTKHPYKSSSPRKEILLFGCSFANGYKINDNETFGAQLAENFNATVYNFAFNGGGLFTSLYVSQNENFQKFFRGKTPDYIIYVYHPGHKDKVFTQFACDRENEYYPSYRIKNKRLVLSDNNPILNKSIIYRKFHYLARRIDSRKLAYWEFTQFWEKMEKMFPNTPKFILLYSKVEKSDDKMLMTFPQKDKVKIIDVKDIDSDVNLFQEKYMEDDHWHPNAKAWHIVTPNFCKKVGECK